MAHIQKITVQYGTGAIDLSLPEQNVAALVRPWLNPLVQSQENSLLEVLRSESAVQFQKQTQGKHLCVLMPDSTRLTGFPVILPDLLGLCRDCERITIVICTGTHCPDTKENKTLIEKIHATARQKQTNQVMVIAHDCQSSDMVSAGTTSRGTCVQYNAGIQEADVFLALSDVKVHYFAGYSNPIKNVMPGICAYQTVEQNHAWTLDPRSTYGRHPWHAQESRRDNPLAADQLEGMSLSLGERPLFALATISAKGKVSWASLGLADEVCREAFSMADAHNTHYLPKVDRLIVTPGGHPDDVDLYIAQRALELTQEVLNNDGELLFLTACPEGVGEPHTRANFYDRLVQPLEDVLNMPLDDYVLFSHKPYRFAQLIQRLRRLWMVSEISDEEIRAMHMEPIKNAQTVVDRWIAEDPQVKIVIVDGANKIALYRQEDGVEVNNHSCL